MQSKHVDFVENASFKIIASQSSSLRDELWMYKSDSNGFFSTTVSVWILNYSDTCYSSTVSLPEDYGSLAWSVMQFKCMEFFIHKLWTELWRHLLLI